MYSIKRNSLEGSRSERLIVYAIVLRGDAPRNKLLALRVIATISWNRGSPNVQTQSAQGQELASVLIEKADKSTAQTTWCKKDKRGNLIYSSRPVTPGDVLYPEAVASRMNEIAREEELMFGGHVVRVATETLFKQMTWPTDHGELKDA